MDAWYEMTVFAGTYNVGSKRYKTGIHYLSEPTLVAHARMAEAKTLVMRLLSQDEVYDLELDGEHADAGDLWEVEQYEPFLSELGTQDEDMLGEDFEAAVGRLDEMLELGMDAFVSLDQERLAEIEDESKDGPSFVDDWFGYGEEDSGWYDLIIEAALQEASEPFNVEEDDDTAELEPFNVEEPEEGDEAQNKDEETKAELKGDEVPKVPKQSRNKGKKKANKNKGKK